MGKKYGNYHLQYLFDDLHVIYMFFTYYVNFQLFQWQEKKKAMKYEKGYEINKRVHVWAKKKQTALQLTDIDWKLTLLL